MSRLVNEVLTICGLIIVEQQKLLQMMNAQHDAMKTLNLPTMELLIAQQEASRLRITSLDYRRKAMARQAAASVSFPGEPTLTKMASLFPAQAQAILKTRDDLKDIIEKINTRSISSSRLSAAVLGHLNTVSRLISGAVQRAGIYTKQGVRQSGGRLGMLEAVG